MPRRERLPALAVPGQAVDSQDLRWTSRSVAMHMQEIGHGLNAARSFRHATTATCRTPMVSCPHVRTADRTNLDRPHRTRYARGGSGAWRRGYRKEQPADRVRD